jgi:hypothetical protein
MQPEFPEREEEEEIKPENPLQMYPFTLEINTIGADLADTLKKLIGFFKEAKSSGHTMCFCCKSMLHT